MRFKSYFIKKKILVIGCGRSGTRFSSKLFQSLGLDVLHEKMGKDGTTSWLQTTTTKKEMREAFKIVLHQVRNPLKVISSLQTFQDNSWSFVNKKVEEFDIQDETILKAMKYWYHWNIMAETKTELRYRVENIEDMLPFVCKLINVRYNDAYKELIGQKVNTREGNFEELSWEDLKQVNQKYHKKCFDLACKYGYQF